MGIIRLQIRKTDTEWKHLEDIIQKKYAERKLIVTGKGYNAFLRSEINKLFQLLEIGDCIEDKNKQIKDFEISLSEKTEKKIRCLSVQLGISPGTLITRMVLDPHLIEK